MDMEQEEYRRSFLKLQNHLKKLLIKSERGIELTKEDVVLLKREISKVKKILTKKD